jgi:hypothetical protein
MTLPEILDLKFPGALIRGDIRLADYGLGNGPEIQYWNTELLGPQPDAATLAQWEAELAPVKELIDVRQSRRDAYPAIGDQLDALYKAMDAGILPKIAGFYEEIKAVKEAFPKPEAV